MSLAVVCGILLAISGVPPATAIIVSALVAAQTVVGRGALRAVGWQTTSAHLESTVGFLIGATLTSLLDRVVYPPRALWITSAVVGSIVGIRRARRDGTLAEPRLGPILLGTAAIGLGHDMLWPLPFGISVLLSVFALRIRSRTARVVGVSIGLAATLGSLAWTAGARPHEAWLTQRKDFVFFDGLSRLIGAARGLDNPFITGQRLDYHWLGYAWLGLVDRIAQPPAWSLTPTIGPVVMTVVIAAGLFGLLECVTSRPRASVLVALVLLASTERSWSTGVHIVRQESFSLLFGTAALVATTAVAVFGGSRRRTSSTAVIVTLAAITTASKISHGAVAAAVCGVSLMRSPSTEWRRVARSGALLLVSQLLVLRFVYGLGTSGADQSARLGLLDLGWHMRPELAQLSGLTYVAATLALLVGICFAAAACIGLVLVTPHLKSAVAPSIGAGVATGLAAGLTLSQILAGEMFFLHASTVLGLIGCAAVLAATELRPRRADLAIAAITGAITLGGMVAPTLSDGSWQAIVSRLTESVAPSLAILAVAVIVGLATRRRGEVGRAIAGSVLVVGAVFALWNWSDEALTYYGREQTSLETTPIADPHVLELASWAHEAIPLHDVTATSAGLCDPSRCTGSPYLASITTECDSRRRSLVGRCYLAYGEPLPAFTERRTYINNFSQYSTGNPTDVMIERAAKSLAFARQPRPESAAPLREAGVKWFIVDKDLPHADDYGAVGTVRYENARFIVLELHDA